MYSQNPVISVLIPCYNVAEFLSQALDSVLAQSEQDFEVLAVDDGSIDATLAILKSYAQKDPRIRIIEHQRNRGIIAARNTLIQHGRGRYFAWLDADDIAREDRLKKQRDFLDLYADYGAVTCQYIEFSEEHEVYRPRKSHDVSKEALLFYNYVLNPGAMVRRELIEDNHIVFDSTLAGASDYQFWVDVSRYGKIGVINEPLMRYRRHTKQESTAQIGRQLRGCQQIVLRQLQALGITHATEDDMAYFLIYPADILGLRYSSDTMRKSGRIVKALLNVLDQHHYGSYAKELAVHLLRRHAVRTGLSGFAQFVASAGLRNMLKSKWFGLGLLKDCILQKY